MTVLTIAPDLMTHQVSNSLRNGIENIGDAIDNKLTICVLAALLPELAAIYPSAKLVGLEHEHRIFRELNKGACGAAILSEEMIQAGFAGKSNTWDCDEQAAGKVTGFDAIVGASCMMKVKRSCHVAGCSLGYQHVGELVFIRSILKKMSKNRM